VKNLKYDNREPLEQVLSNYDINTQSIITETYKDKKAVWWVQTDKGLLVLKKISNSEQTLKYIMSAIKHLGENGIYLPSVIKTKNGMDYAITDRTCYVLSTAVKGKNPSYDSANELEIIIKELARFHLASEGFRVLPDTKPKIHLGMWKENLTSRLEDIKGFYDKEVSAKGSNEIGAFIITEFPYFQKRALSAISALGEDYLSWVEKVRQRGGLCHQDFAAGNLILSPSGKLYVLDTDGITVDLPARDIRKILCKVMKKKGKWDIELTKSILKTYQSVNPLTPAEWRVVKADIEYPHLFMGAVNKYYYRRDKEWTEEKYFRRIKEMCAFEKTIAPVLDNYEKLIPY